MLEPLRHSLDLSCSLVVHDQSHRLCSALAHFLVPVFPVLLLADIAAVGCVLATRADEQAAILALALAALHVHGGASLLLLHVKLAKLPGRGIFPVMRCAKIKWSSFYVHVRFTRKRRKSRNRTWKPPETNTVPLFENMKSHDM
jgi:hypothetical protein